MGLYWNVSQSFTHSKWENLEITCTSYSCNCPHKTVGHGRIVRNIAGSHVYNSILCVYIGHFIKYILHN